MKMKPISLLVVFCAQLTFAQYPPPLLIASSTKLEIFAARKNAVLTTENYFVPGFSGDNGCHVRIQAIILYEAGHEAQKIRGLKVEIVEPRQNKDERSVTVYVDYDEIESLSKAITTMLDVTQRGTLLANPIAKEVSFTTAGGLTLAMVQRNKERQLLLSHSLQPDLVCAVSQGRSITDFKTSLETALQSMR